MTNDDKSLPGRLGNRSDRLNRSNQIVESLNRSHTTMDGSLGSLGSSFIVCCSPLASVFIYELILCHVCPICLGIRVFFSFLSFSFLSLDVGSFEWQLSWVDMISGLRMRSSDENWNEIEIETGNWKCNQSNASVCCLRFWRTAH